MFLNKNILKGVPPPTLSGSDWLTGYDNLQLICTQNPGIRAKRNVFGPFFPEGALGGRRTVQSPRNRWYSYQASTTHVFYVSHKHCLALPRDVLEVLRHYKEEQLDTKPSRAGLLKPDFGNPEVKISNSDEIHSGVV